MAIYIWVDIGSDNGLLPDDTKPWSKFDITRDIRWHSAQRNFTETALDLTYNKVFGNYTFENTVKPLI